MFIQAKAAANSSTQKTEQISNYILTTENTNEATAGPSSECDDNSTDLIFHDDFCTDNLTHENNEAVDVVVINNNDKPDQDHDDDEDLNTRYNWTYEQTLLLIQSYGIHEEEKSHPKQRKHMWDNIANDMISHGHDVNKKLCYTKWTNLLRSYKSAKDQIHGNKKTGQAPSKFIFYDVIDELLGEKPSNSSSQTLSSLSQQSLIKNERRRKMANNCSNHEGKEEDNDINQQSTNTTAKRRQKMTQKQRKFKSDFQKEGKENKDEKLKRQEKKRNLERERLAIEKEKLAVIKAYLQDRAERKATTSNSDI
ncbi:unnamed protein product [Lasius platythorax]|uniref:Myb/SANT-like DNA-binding domain-containing protein n=1 Tax=Lasius platythorax TaxID=488582 RepID=A0AAV2NLC4_9HYME